MNESKLEQLREILREITTGKHFNTGFFQTGYSFDFKLNTDDNKEHSITFISSQEAFETISEYFVDNNKRDDKILKQIESILNANGIGENEEFSITFIAE